MFIKGLLLGLLFPYNFAQSSSCVCTTVDCPVEGKNTVIMGDGNANITYMYSMHNDYEVVISASGTVEPDSLDHGSETTSCTQKYSRILEDDGYENCDAGHILANRLGGYGNIPTNIFPQNANSNRGVYAQFEGAIYNYIKNNMINAAVKWEFFYKSNKYTMPYSVNYTAIFDDGYTINSLFANE